MASQPQRRYGDGRTAEQHQSLVYISECLQEAPGTLVSRRMRIMESIADHLLILAPLLRETHIRLRCTALDVMSEYARHERIHEPNNGRLLNLIRDVMRALE